MSTLPNRVEEDDEEFLRKLILREEDRRRRYRTMGWVGGYRWFRSENVVDLDRYRDGTARERIRKNVVARHKETA
jgi:hypothetical protein